MKKLPTQLDEKQDFGAVDNKLFSASEIGNKIGVCAATVRRMESKGQIKGIRFNKRLVRYPGSEVTRLIKEAK
ncbi:MAG: hypothetical protein ABIR24_03510 [Verrucomicrobiota bacterium]